MAEKKIKAVALTDKLEACVRFARWCQENRIPPADAGQLHALARRAWLAATRACNGRTRSADRERRAFERVAGAWGFRVRWDGLMPTLKTRRRRRSTTAAFRCAPT